MTKSKPKILRNVVMRSELTHRFFFVPKARDLGNGRAEVLGQKIDVTESMQRFVLKKFRQPPEKARAK